jgi:hypothetical protein
MTQMMSGLVRIGVVSLAMLLAAWVHVAAVDAISGTWTGEITMAGRDQPVAITLVLKLDGKNAVTGTFAGLPNPGDVKAGTFDPKTGALKLRLGKVGDPAVLLVFDGTLAKDKVTGRVSGEVGGTFTVSRKP